MKYVMSNILENYHLLLIVEISQMHVEMVLVLGSNFSLRQNELSCLLVSLQNIHQYLPVLSQVGYSGSFLWVHFLRKKEISELLMSITKETFYNS